MILNKGELKAQSTTEDLQMELTSFHGYYFRFTFKLQKKSTYF